MHAFALALGIYITSSASAQEKSAGGKTTVTGCLQKGDEAEEYSITGEDGKTYGLRSKLVKLSQHLGHKVTITGTLRAEAIIVPLCSNTYTARRRARALRAARESIS